VILNPPRTGVDARVTSALAGIATAPRAIVYVSCDPATLARDLSRLPGWTIARLTAFDMFPQTAHVETVCELVPVTA
jgi:23S rRNA (uracil1939-C5)-methyltransferase